MRRKWTKERSERDPTFELLFKNNPLPLWVYDLQTLRFLDINEVACRKYGWSREEFLALTMRDIRPPEDIRECTLRYVHIRRRFSLPAFGGIGRKMEPPSTSRVSRTRSFTRG